MLTFAYIVSTSCACIVSSGRERVNRGAEAIERAYQVYLTALFEVSNSAAAESEGCRFLSLSSGHNSGENEDLEL